MSPPKKSRGRQKVEMKKMSNESNLQVTFSKRRTGLFKKASELTTLCGAEVAIIVFSPGDKAFSFGHPSIGAVLNRYLNRVSPQPSETMQIIEAHRNANVRDLNSQLTEVMTELEAERKRAQELTKMRKTMQENCWFAGNVDDMTRAELEKIKMTMEELKRKLTREIDRFLVQSASNEADQFYAFNSSVSIPVPPPPAAPQVFPPYKLQQPIITQNPPPQMLQPTMMSQNHGVQNPMFDGTMMPFPPLCGFNNIGGYGPGFY